MPFWRARDEIDAELKAILARVEGLESTWKTTQKRLKGPDDDEPGIYETELESGKPFRNIRFERWVLDDADEWRIAMRFTRPTPDGTLVTEIESGAHYARVEIAVGHVSLASYLFRDGPGSYGPGTKISRATVQHVRHWVRQRVLPEFQAVEQQRKSALEKHETERAGLRKKYLP